MRFKEFAPIFEAEVVAGDQLINALNNYINTAALKDKEQGLPMKFNWKGFANLISVMVTKWQQITKHLKSSMTARQKLLKPKSKTSIQIISS